MSLFKALIGRLRKNPSRVSLYFLLNNYSPSLRDGIRKDHKGT